MKKLICALLPLLFSVLYISAQSESIHDTTAVEIGQLIDAKHKDYYFHSSNQLLTEKYSYVGRALNASSNEFRVDDVSHESTAHLVGKLNTGEIIDLSKLLYPGHTEAIRLESDTTYQITFSGNLRFVVTVYSFGYNVSYEIKVNVELYGKDTFTLRPNESNIIQVDIARPPKLVSHIRDNAKMRCKLHVTNK